MGHVAVSQQKRAEYDRRQCRDLHESGHFAHGCSDSSAEDVGESESDDGGDRDHLNGRRLRRHAEHVEQEFPENSGKRGNGSRRRDQHIQPSKYERSRLAICFAQEHIYTTRLRQQRRQLRDRERAANADQAEGCPESDYDQRIWDEPGDCRRCAEDAATNGDADDECRSAEEPDDAPKILRPWMNGRGQERMRKIWWRLI